MPEYQQRPQTGHECAPPADPADQPRPPAGGDACEDLPISTPPPEPELKPCPPPDSACKCPTRPGTTPTCLEDLIAKQIADIAAADKAKTFKTDLEALLAKAKAANQEYTRDKYEKLRKQWVAQDAEIAELVRKLVCAVTCWRCIIDCYICPFLNELHTAEQRLYGDGTQYSEVHNLQDLLYWHIRNRDALERAFNRIKWVLAAWEKPAQTIEKALADNAKLIADAGKSLGSEASKVVLDVFFRLIPMHLAIAPPSGAGWPTKIAKEYTQFCECDTGTADDCCGPNVGAWSLRQRLIGPQPYLIDPNDYFTVICCLVQRRYGPAKEALGTAEAAVVTADNDIKRLKAQIENGLKSFDKDAKGAIPSVIVCCDKALQEPESQPAQAR